MFDLRNHKTEFGIKKFNDWNLKIFDVVKGPRAWVEF